MLSKNTWKSKEKDKVNSELVNKIIKTHLQKTYKTNKLSISDKTFKYKKALNSQPSKFLSLKLAN